MMIVMSASSEESGGQQGTHGPKLDEYEVHKIHFTSNVNIEVLNQKVHETTLENGTGVENFFR